MFISRPTLLFLSCLCIVMAFISESARGVSKSMSWMIYADFSADVRSRGCMTDQEWLSFTQELPTPLANATSPLIVSTIAWSISAGGILLLALCAKRTSHRIPPQTDAPTSPRPTATP